MTDQKDVLYRHLPHPHTSRHATVRQSDEQAHAGLNARLAILLTRGVGTMWCAYLFAGLAVAGFPGLLSPIVSQYVQWTSQTFIQLTMLSILMVGQGVLGRKSELQADEAYKAIVNSYHDVEQVMHHLDAQDGAIVEIDRKIDAKIDTVNARLDALTVWIQQAQAKPRTRGQKASDG